MGVTYPIFMHKSFSLDQIKLHPEFHVPRPSVSALKVWGGGWWLGGCVEYIGF